MTKLSTPFALATILLVALPLAEQNVTPPITDEAPRSEPRARPIPAMPKPIKTLANENSIWHANVPDEGKSVEVALDSHGPLVGQ